MNSNFKTIGIVGRYYGIGSSHTVRQLAQYLIGRGHEVIITAHTAEIGQIHDLNSATLEEIGRLADLVIVLGGDGTMLNVARTLVDHRVPMIGINHGRLGFLADVAVDSMFTTLDGVLAGRYIAEDRILLSAQLWRQGQVCYRSYAFNDVVVSKSTLGRLIEFEIYIDNQFVYNQRADGLVVATPTGSTAYALSAGGPILHPTLEAFVLTPICPHTLSARPIAVNSRSEIEINLIQADDARVHFDGQQHADMQVGDRVVIQRAENTVRLLHPENHNYYHTLRQKLHWGEKLS